MSEGLQIMRKILEDRKYSLSALNPDTLNDEERPVYDFIMEYLKDSGEYPPISVIEEEANVEIPEAPGSLKVYMKRLSDRVIYNAIYDRLPGIQKTAKKESGLADKLASEFKELHLACSLNDPDTELRDNKASHERFDREIYERRILGDPPGVSTGYQELDRHYGGHIKGDVNLLVARPAMGKTYAAMANALKFKMAERDAVVLTISCEMTESQMMARQLFLLTGIDPQTIVSGQVSTANMEGLRRAQEFLKAWKGFYSVYEPVDTGRVASRLNELRPDFLLVDGMYMLKPEDYHPRMDMQTQALTVVKEIKAAAKTFDLPVFATTQFNRQAGKGGRFGSMETIGYTGGFEQYCSNIFAYIAGDPRQARPDRKFRTWSCIKSRDHEPWDLVTKFQFKPKSFDSVAFFRHVEREESERNQNRRGDGRQRPNPVATPAEYGAGQDFEDDDA